MDIEDIDHFLTIGESKKDGLMTVFERDETKTLTEFEVACILVLIVDVYTGKVPENQQIEFMEKVYGSLEFIKDSASKFIEKKA